MVGLREARQETKQPVLQNELQSRIVSCEIKQEELISQLDDGRKIVVPINLLTKWRVLEENIKSEQLKKYELWGEGQVIFFPEIDETLPAWIIIKGLRSGCRD